MNQKVAVSVVFVSAMFINIMDITIVNVALPTIGRELHTDPKALSAVAVGFLVALAVTIPASGWLGDRFGLKRVLLTAIVLFTGASALCGAAQTFGQLVLFRVLQGAGGGMLTPVGMALLFRTFPPAERVRASAILTLPTAFAPALGPVLGGLIVSDWSWRWAFFVNVPIGALGLLFGLVYLQEPERHPAGGFDLLGFLLAGAGFALFMFGISEGPHRGWSDPPILIGIFGGGTLIALLIRQQLTRTDPLLNLRLLSNRLLRTATSVIFFAAAAFLGSLFTISLFFQEGLGLSPLASGLSTFPEAAGVMVGSQVASRVLYPRIGARRLMLLGLTGLGLCMLLLTQVDARSDLWWMRIVMFFIGYAISHNFVAAQATAFSEISHADTARASTIFNALRQLGAATGVAVLATVLSEVGPITVTNGKPVANLGAYHWSFAAATVLAWIGAAIANSLRSDQELQGPPARQSAPSVEPIVVGS